MSEIKDDRLHQWMKWAVWADGDAGVRWAKRDLEGQLTATWCEDFPVGPLNEFVDQLASQPFDEISIDALLLFLRTKKLQIVGLVHVVVLWLIGSTSHVRLATPASHGARSGAPPNPPAFLIEILTSRQNLIKIAGI